MWTYPRKRESNLISLRSHGAQRKISYSVGSRLDWLDLDVVVESRFFFFLYHFISSTCSRHRHKECRFSPAFIFRSDDFWSVHTRLATAADAAEQTNEILPSQIDAEKKLKFVFNTRVRYCRLRMHTADWLVKWRLCVFINDKARRERRTKINKNMIRSYLNETWIGNPSPKPLSFNWKLYIYEYGIRGDREKLPRSHFI